MIDRTLNYGRDLIKQYLHLSSPFASVLDIGAGAGEDLNTARNVNPAAKLFAVENHMAHVMRLREDNVTVFQLNIEKDRLPFEKDAIDIIIANQILEHTKEIFWIMHETSRVLKVGGTFILGVPNLAALHNRILLACGRQPSPVKTCSAHIRGFTKKDLLDFLEACFPGGYKLTAFGGSNFYPFPPLFAKPLAKAFPALAWGIFFMFKKQKEYYREFLEYPVKERLETNYFTGTPGHIK